MLLLSFLVAPLGAVTPTHPERVRIEIGGELDLVSDYYAPRQRTAPGLLLLHGWDWPERAPASGLSVYAREFQRAGYAVLVPNMRGWPPTGGRDDCGGRQVDDSQAALRWLGARESVDPERLFVAGYSQGGQVAMLTATRGAQVRAIVAFAPVTELQSWGEQTDTPGIRGYLHAECGGPAGWSGRSVVAQETDQLPPLLLVHGDADRRVPTSQSLNLYRRLRNERGDAELRLIPGAGHAIDAVLIPRLAIEFFAINDEPRGEPALSGGPQS
jgi:dipeptidyl aminopeptidase/acylaminoacyl peptidase